MGDSMVAAIALTGGGAGALDDINHNSLADGDLALVVDATTEQSYMFTYDSSSSASEAVSTSDDQMIVKPDSNSGNGRWKGAAIYSANWAEMRAFLIATSLNASLTGLGLALDQMWIPAAAMKETTTNGAALGSNEYATNDIMMQYFAFSGATEQFVDFDMVMPPSWDRGEIKFKAYWGTASGSSQGDTVEWEFVGGAVSNDGAIDTDHTASAEVISDAVTAGTNGDLHITGASPAITVAGTPALGDLIHVKLSRNVGGTDDMTEDAWLYGILIQFSHSNKIAAW